MNCPKCKNEFVDNAKFCTKCGSEISYAGNGKGEKSNHRLVSTIVVILIIVIGGYLIINNSSSSSKTATIQDYFTDSNSWKEFNSVEGSFKVSLPTLPTHETNSITIPNSDLTGTIELYTSTKGDSTYFIQAIRYNGEIDVSNPHRVLEGALNGRVSEIPNHKIISSNFGEFISNDSLDYLVQSDSYYIYGKLILVGQRLYALEMACEAQKCFTKDYQNFTNSFQLQ